MKGKIVVIGSSNTDLIVKIPVLPKPGETVVGGEFYKAAGGKGANQAVAAARAGADVVFISRIGNDEFGQASLELYKKEGINTDFIISDSEHPSGIALIFVDKEGENSIAVASGANSYLSPDDIDKCKDVINSADIVLLQLEIPIETAQRIINIAHEKNKKIILNPAPAQQIPEDIINKITIIIPNEHEAEYLTGTNVYNETSACVAGEQLLAKGIENVILTLGSKGVYYKSHYQEKSIPAIKVQPLDTTAAGDVFVGSFAAALAENKSFEESIKFANAAASISVTRLGAQPSIPLREDINYILSQIKLHL